jgi:hypothetical protein
MIGASTSPNARTTVDDSKLEIFTMLPCGASAGQTFHHGILSTPERCESRLVSGLQKRDICWYDIQCMFARKTIYLYQ